MPRSRPPFVECWRDRHKKLRVFFRRGKGARIPLPVEIGSEEFNRAYAAALEGYGAPTRERGKSVAPGTLGALIVSYKKSKAYGDLRETTLKGYNTRLETIRLEHGHRSVSGLTRERIEGMLAPYSDRPGAALDTLKKVRILIQHAMSLEKKNLLRLSHDPSAGIKRPEIKEIRAWTDAECAAFEKRWPIGTKQRTAYALMLYVGTARVDVHQMTWRQFADSGVAYTRSKTGVGVDMSVTRDLQKALAAAPHDHVTIINTEYGKPFTVGGFSGFMRDAMTAAGLPLDCKPHGLRKTLGRRLADAGATAHEIMAMLGHTTLEEAERYTRQADRRRGARQAVIKLERHSANTGAQPTSNGVGKVSRTIEGSK